MWLKSQLDVEQPLQDQKMQFPPRGFLDHTFLTQA
jgi:hypothetical protein